MGSRAQTQVIMLGYSALLHDETSPRPFACLLVCLFIYTYFLLQTGSLVLRADLELLLDLLPPPPKSWVMRIISHYTWLPMYF